MIQLPNYGLHKVLIENNQDYYNIEIGHDLTEVSNIPVYVKVKNNNSIEYKLKCYEAAVNYLTEKMNLAPKKIDKNTILSALNSAKKQIQKLKHEKEVKGN